MPLPPNGSRQEEEQGDMGGDISDEKKLDEESPDELSTDEEFNGLDDLLIDARDESDQDQANDQPAQPLPLGLAPFLHKNVHYHSILDVRDECKTRAASTTQFHEVAIKCHHRMTKALVTAIQEWTQAPYFQAESVVGADQCNNRRRQLFPLHLLYVLNVSITKKHLRKIKKRGFSSNTLTLKFPFLNHLDVIIRELNYPGMVNQNLF
jgi:hypothetical protein